MYITPTEKQKAISNLEWLIHRNQHNLMPQQTEIMYAALKFITSDIGAKISIPENQDYSIYSNHFMEKLSEHMLIISATGTGKTRSTGALFEALAQPVIIFTPRQMLNQQTKKEFSEELNIPSELIGIYDSTVSEKQKLLEVQKPIIIAGYMSLPGMTQIDKKSGLRILDPKFGRRPFLGLDEAHLADGPQTAQIFDDLKHSSTLVGFTATDAGVSRRLFDNQAPIYNLNLISALKRGILANGIRTGVIEVKIDEEWIENFRIKLSNPDDKKDYKYEDLERFARTPAVINTFINFHLQHEDELLGKIDNYPTLVFTTGVGNAKDGAKKFNEAAIARGSSVRAGYVASNEPELIDGVMNDFRNRKIKVLFNDSIISVGIDLPESTIIYSLKNTLQAETAEQQLGRIGRKQKQGYFENYGRNKVGLAINIIAKGMTPYTFSEVLGNVPAIFAETELGKSLEDRYLGNANRTPKLLANDNVEFYISYSEMLHLAEEGLHRKANDLNIRPQAGWLLMVEAARQLKTDEKRLSPLWNSLDDLTLDKKISIGLDDGSWLVNVKDTVLNFIRFKNDIGKYSYYVNENYLPNLRQYLGIAEDRPKTGWHNCKETCNLLDMSYSVGSAVCELWEEFKKIPENKIEYIKLPDNTYFLKLDSGNQIRVALYRNNSGNPLWNISEDSIDALKRHFDVIEKKPAQGWKKMTDVVAYHKSNNSDGPIAIFWRDLPKIVKDKNRAELQEDGSYIIDPNKNGNLLRLKRYKAGGTKAYFLDETYIDEVPYALDFLKNKPEGWYGYEMVTQKLSVGMGPETPMGKFWAKLPDLLKSENAVRIDDKDRIWELNYEGKKIKFAEFRAGSSPELIVTHKDTIKDLARALWLCAPAKPAMGWKNLTDIGNDGNNSQILKSAWREIEELIKTNTLPEKEEYVWHVPFKGQNFDFRYLKYGNISSFCIMQEQVQLLEECLRENRKKPEGWYSNDEVAIKLGVSADKKLREITNHIGDLITNKDESVNDLGNSEYLVTLKSYGNETIHVGRFDNITQTVYTYYPQHSFVKLQKLLGIEPELPEGWLSQSQIRQALRVNDHLTKFWNNINDHIANPEISTQLSDNTWKLKFDESEIIVGKFRCKGAEATLYLHNESLSDLRKILKIAPDKTKEWLNLEETLERLPNSNQKPLKEAWPHFKNLIQIPEIAEAKGDSKWNIKIGNEEIQIAFLRNWKITSFCLHEKSVRAFSKVKEAIIKIGEDFLATEQNNKPDAKLSQIEVKHVKTQQNQSPKSNKKNIVFFTHEDNKSSSNFRG